MGYVSVFFCWKLYIGVYIDIVDKVLLVSSITYLCTATVIANSALYT